MKKQTRKFDVDAECKFSDVPPLEIEAACKYEYMRESHALRVKVKKEPEPSIAPYLHRIAPYRDRLFRSCKADCPRQWGLQRNKQGPAEYRIYCSHCGNAVDLPCDDWVLKFVALASRPATASPTEASKATKVPSFCGETFTRVETYRLIFALRKAGFPKPWTTLKKNARKELIPVISGWYEERKKAYPPVVIEEAMPEQDLEGERERLVRQQSLIAKPKSPASAAAQNAADAFIRAMRPPIWRFTPSQPELLRRGQQSQRKYFYGFIRIDEGYNETEAAEAFKKEFRKRWPKTKGGGTPKWRERLKQLAVMRIWKYDRNRKAADYIKQWKRVTKVAEFCEYKNCMQEAAAYKERCSEGRADQPISNAAEVEMSSARADAREFFQRLFPGEEPLSW
jgi:hypothetical protein